MPKNKAGKNKADKPEQPAFDPIEDRSEEEAAEFGKLLVRLRRIEGQVRGVHHMLEENRDSTAVLVQLAAIKSAVNKVAMHVVERHTFKNALPELPEDSQKQVKQLLQLVEQLTK